MKIFFYTGRNERNVSGVSWKIWKIERKGKRLQTWWGPAEVLQRQVVPKFLQTWSANYPTENAAKEDEKRRINEKTREGYERKPRQVRASFRDTRSATPRLPSSAVAAQSFSRAIKPTSTSSGSKTKASKTAPTSPIPTCWPAKS